MYMVWRESRTVNGISPCVLSDDKSATWRHYSTLLECTYVGKDSLYRNCASISMKPETAQSVDSIQLGPDCNHLPSCP